MDDNLPLITQFFSGIWDLFTSVQVPLLNIPFSSLWIGVFVAAFAVTLLRPLLGIGAGTVSTLSRGLHGSSRNLGKSTSVTRSSGSDEWEGTRRVSSRGYQPSASFGRRRSVTWH